MERVIFIGNGEPVVFEKFNPYHGRDGRFSGADGATSFTWRPDTVYGANAIAREKARAAALATEESKGGFIPAKTMEEAKEYARTKLGFDSTELEKLPLESANFVNKGITEIQTKVPEVQGQVQRLIVSSTTKSDAYVTTYSNGEIELTLSKKHFSDLSKMQEDTVKAVKSGWHPAGTDTTNGNVASNHTIVHEYGHVYASTMSRKKFGIRAGVTPDDYNKKVDFINDRKGRGWEHEAVKAVARQNKTKIADFPGKISRYAKTNDAETWAEAFSEVYTSPSPRAEATALLGYYGLKK